MRMALPNGSDEARRYTRTVDTHGSILHGTDSTLYLGTTSGELGGIPLDTWPADWDPLRIMVG